MIVKKIVIHHTASSRDKTTLQDVDNWHKLRWPDFKSSLGYYVGYHYLITSDGIVHQTRSDNELGAHTIPNDGKLGICLTGNFEIETPTDLQLVSLQTLLNQKTSEYGLKNLDITGHQEWSNTSCPGKFLFIWILQNRISFIQQFIDFIKKSLGIK